MTTEIDPMLPSSIPPKHWPRLAPVALALGLTEWVLLIVSDGVNVSAPTAWPYQWQGVTEAWLNYGSLPFLVGSIVVARTALQANQVDRRGMAFWAIVCAVAAWPITYLIKAVVLVIALLQLPTPLF